MLQILLKISQRVQRKTTNPRGFVLNQIVPVAFSWQEDKDNHQTLLLDTAHSNYYFVVLNAGYQGIFWNEVAISLQLMNQLPR